MRMVLNAAQMKACDKATIETYGIASLVLQERAALAVCRHIEAESTEPDLQKKLPDRGSVFVYAGVGNNGADAVACARILSGRGYRPRIFLVGEEARATEEMRAQLHSAAACGIPAEAFSKTIESSFPGEVPVCIIDGLFGIGLNRAPEGAAADAIREINAWKERGVKVVSVDIPSGVNADDGSVPGEAVRADCTVTFAFRKAGQLLYPGASYCGELYCEDIGIPAEALPKETIPAAFCYQTAEEAPLPARSADGNKGSFGKVLLAAGSETIGGAAILAAKAVLGSGAGMVRVLTARGNRDALLTAVPEALLDIYDNDTTDAALEELCRKALAWADVLVAGPGIGTGEQAGKMLHTLLTQADLPLVLDADALNLIAAPDSALPGLLKAYAKKGHPVVLTPHIGEFCRLYQAVFGKPLSAEECKANLLRCPKELSKALGVVLLCKDARSVIADAAPDQNGQDKPLFINTSGNDGMATAGSGDVLSGMIGAFLAGGLDAFAAACTGAYLHGCAGDLAAKETGKRAMTASDLLSALPLHDR